MGGASHKLLSLVPTATLELRNWAECHGVFGNRLLRILELNLPGSILGIIARDFHSDSAPNLLIHLGANLAIWSECSLKLLEIQADFSSTIGAVPASPG